MKARIRPVVSKVMDSLHLHTVNMGQGAQPLPSCLLSLPKHYLANFSLSSAIGKLTDLGSCSFIVQMNGFIIDLVDWI